MHQALLQDWRASAITHNMNACCCINLCEVCAGGRAWTQAHLIGVAWAFFRNVAVVHCVSAHNSQELHLQGGAQLEEDRRVYTAFTQHGDSNNAKCCVPGNRCSRGRCYTWSLGSARTCCSRPRLLWHTPKKKETDTLIWLKLLFMTETNFGEMIVN